MQLNISCTAANLIFVNLAMVQAYWDWVFVILCQVSHYDIIIKGYYYLSVLCHLHVIAISKYKNKKSSFSTKIKFVISTGTCFDFYI